MPTVRNKNFFIFLFCHLKKFSKSGRSVKYYCRNCADNLLKIKKKLSTQSQSGTETYRQKPF